MSVCIAKVKTTTKAQVTQNREELSSTRGLVSLEEKGKETSMTDNSVATLPTKLGQAEFVGKFENNSPEWHELRAQGIGGSSVSTILGLNPWESAYTFAAKRLGLIESSIKQSEAMEWGTRLESVVIDKFAENHPELTVYRNVGTWRSRKRDWQIVNPDAIFEDVKVTRRGDDQDLFVHRGIFEAKTAAYEDDWIVPAEGVMGTADGVPVYYRCQVQWYLQIFGFTHAIVGVLFHGNKYREFEIFADEFEQDVNLQIVEQFKTEYLDTKTLPEFSAPFTSTLQTVRELHPEIEDVAVELGPIGSAYLSALEALSHAEDAVNLIKSEVLAMMKTARKGLVDGKLAVTRQSKKGGTPYLVNARK